LAFVLFAQFFGFSQTVELELPNKNLSLVYSLFCTNLLVFFCVISTAGDAGIIEIAP